MRRRIGRFDDSKKTDTSKAGSRIVSHFSLALPNQIRRVLIYNGSAIIFFFFYFSLETKLINLARDRANEHRMG